MPRRSLPGASSSSQPSRASMAGHVRTTTPAPMANWDTCSPAEATLAQSRRAVDGGTPQHHHLQALRPVAGTRRACRHLRNDGRAGGGGGGGAQGAGRAILAYQRAGGRARAAAHWCRCSRRPPRPWRRSCPRRCACTCTQGSGRQPRHAGSRRLSGAVRARWPSRSMRGGKRWEQTLLASSQLSLLLSATPWRSSSTAAEGLLRTPAAHSHAAALVPVLHHHDKGLEAAPDQEPTHKHVDGCGHEGKGREADGNGKGHSPSRPRGLAGACARAMERGAACARTGAVDGEAQQQQRRAGRVVVVLDPPARVMPSAHIARLLSARPGRRPWAGAQHLPCVLSFASGVATSGKQMMTRTRQGAAPHARLRPPLPTPCNRTRA